MSCNIILFLILPIIKKNVEIIHKSQVVQKQVVSQVWPVDHSLLTSGVNHRRFIYRGGWWPVELSLSLSEQYQNKPLGNSQPVLVALECHSSVLTLGCVIIFFGKNRAPHMPCFFDLSLSSTGNTGFVTYG